MNLFIRDQGYNASGETPSPKHLVQKCLYWKLQTDY